MTALGMTTAAMAAHLSHIPVASKGPVKHAVPRVVLRKHRAADRPPPVEAAAAPVDPVVRATAEEQKTWDTTAHTPAYYKAELRLRLLEKQQSIEATQRAETQVERAKPVYFPISLDTDDNSDDIILGKKEFVSNYERICSGIVRDGMLRFHEPRDIAAQSTSSITLPAPQFRHDPDDDDCLARSHASSSSSEAPVADNETAESTPIELPILEPEVTHRDTSDTSDRNICRKELAALFNLLQSNHLVTVKAEDASSAAATEKMKLRGKGKKKGKLGAGATAAADGPPEPSVLEYILEHRATPTTTSKSPVGNPGFQYLSNTWTVKQRVLDAILTARFDLEHVSQLAAKVTMLTEDLRSTKALLARTEELFVRERQKNEVLSVKHNVAVAQTRSTRVQMGQLVQQLQRLLDCRIMSSVDEAYRDHSHLWFLLREKVDEEVDKVPLKDMTAHDQLVRDLGWKVKVKYGQVQHRRQLEEMEKVAMEGADLLSAANQLFTIGETVEVNINNLLAGVYDENLLQYLAKERSNYADLSESEVETENVEVQTDPVLIGTPPKIDTSDRSTQIDFTRKIHEEHKAARKRSMVQIEGLEHEVSYANREVENLRSSLRNAEKELSERSAEVLELKEKLESLEVKLQDAESREETVRENWLKAEAKRRKDEEDLLADLIDSDNAGELHKMDLAGLPMPVQWALRNLQRVTVEHAEVSDASHAGSSPPGTPTSDHTFTMVPANRSPRQALGAASSGRAAVPDAHPHDHSRKKDNKDTSRSSERRHIFVPCGGGRGTFSTYEHIPEGPYEQSKKTAVTRKPKAANPRTRPTLLADILVSASGKVGVVPDLEILTAAVEEQEQQLRISHEEYALAFLSDQHYMYKKVLLPVLTSPTTSPLRAPAQKRLGGLSASRDQLNKMTTSRSGNATSLPFAPEDPSHLACAVAALTIVTAAAPTVAYCPPRNVAESALRRSGRLSARASVILIGASLTATKRTQPPREPVPDPTPRPTRDTPQRRDVSICSLAPEMDVAEPFRALQQQQPPSSRSRSPSHEEDSSRATRTGTNTPTAHPLGKGWFKEFKPDIQEDRVTQDPGERALKKARRLPEPKGHYGAPRVLTATTSSAGTELLVSTGRSSSSSTFPMLGVAPGSAVSEGPGTRGGMPGWTRPHKPKKSVVTIADDTPPHDHLPVLEQPQRSALVLTPPPPPPPPPPPAPPPPQPSVAEQLRNLQRESEKCAERLQQLIALQSHSKHTQVTQMTLVEKRLKRVRHMVDSGKGDVVPQVEAVLRSLKSDIAKQEAAQKVARTFVSNFELASVDWDTGDRTVRPTGDDANGTGGGSPGPERKLPSRPTPHQVLLQQQSAQHGGGSPPPVTLTVGVSAMGRVRGTFGPNPNASGALARQVSTYRDGSRKTILPPV